MGKLKERKWPFIVLSLLLAIALWFYVRVQENTDTSKPLDRVPVVFSGLETLESRGLMIVPGYDNQTVSLRINGQWTTMNRVTNDTVHVVVNLSRITEAGEYRLPYDVEFDDNVTASGMRVQDRNPSQLTLMIADYAEKDVEIQTVFTGSVAEGFQTGRILASPESIHISGDARLVEQVAAARITLTGSNLSSTLSGDYHFDLVDEQGEVLDATGITCSMESVFVTLPIVTVKDIPLTVDLLPGGGATADNGTCTVSIDPAMISVSGEPEDLAELTELKLGTIDLAQVVSTGTYTFNIVLPSTLTNISEVTTATVTVTVNHLATKMVTVNHIDLKNIPEGYKATAVTRSKDILIRGSESVVNSITSNNVRVVADLSEAPHATGRYTVEASVVLEGVADAGAVGDYTVVINLTR